MRFSFLSSTTKPSSNPEPITAWSSATWNNVPALHTYPCGTIPPPLTPNAIRFTTQNFVSCAAGKGIRASHMPGSNLPLSHPQSKYYPFKAPVRTSFAVISLT